VAQSSETVVSPSVVRELASIVGPANIVTAHDELVVYECDAYTLEKSLPTVVVLPHTTDEVATVRSSHAAQARA